MLKMTIANKIEMSPQQNCIQTEKYKSQTNNTNKKKTHGTATLLVWHDTNHEG